MAQLVPVDGDPFAPQGVMPGAVPPMPTGLAPAPAQAGPKLVPVEGNPFEAPSTAEDVAKSGGIGLAKGAIGLAGLPGDIGSLVSAASDKLGIPQSVKAALGNVAGALPIVNTLKGPGGADIQKKIEGITGEFYKPKTTLGEYAQTAGEFAPALIGGPETLLAKLGTRVALPAVASETAGQLTKGTAAEPYARAAAAIGSSVLAHRAPAAAPGPTAEHVLDAASAGYKSPAIAAVTYQPRVVEKLADDIIADLKKAKLNDRLAGNVHSVVDDMRNPVNPVTGAGPGTHTIEDLETTRRLLGKMAGNFANPTEQTAAIAAKGKIDKFMDQVRQADLATGNAKLANQALLSARADYAAGKTAQTVAEKIRNAELQAGSAHSGGNIDNATRQKLRTLLTSKKAGRGLTDEELALVETSVLGTPLGNTLRTTGKLLGGGGGLGGVVSAVVGHGALGPAGVAAPLVGYGVKKLGDMITRRNANKIIETILSRSPEAQRWQAMQARIAAANPPTAISAPMAGLQSGALAVPSLRAIDPIAQLSPP